jgi:VIT1/CCC1 family predicted Fe2+/Mn2+ transporter
MGVAYVLGGAVSVLPYLFLPIGPAMGVSVAATFLALFMAGGLKGRVVGRSWWRSGLEMLLVAGAAALAGYGVGRFFRVRLA